MEIPSAEDGTVDLEALDADVVDVGKADGALLTRVDGGAQWPVDGDEAHAVPHVDVVFVVLAAAHQQSVVFGQRSEELLAQLQSAHDQLQTYANQAEDLAIANERTRLARDLHDSVAQTLYGLTLQAEVASRKLAAGHPDAVKEHLHAIQEDARQTLQETRLLIFELRPP